MAGVCLCDWYLASCGPQVTLTPLGLCIAASNALRPHLQGTARLGHLSALYSLGRGLSAAPCHTRVRRSGGRRTARLALLDACLLASRELTHFSLQLVCERTELGLQARAGTLIFTGAHGFHQPVPSCTGLLLRVEVS